MLASNRDFPIGNACNNNAELWCQDFSSPKDTIKEDQIKSWVVTDHMSLMRVQSHRFPMSKSL